ncbi:PadR family transcriptional regulator [Nesterenkonia ebinurensis]|uniref:PadR family transcriptional regulator n=1 Tax=Nesterenkonia ebinurensis TaxID=2608252 RepID=UPI001CC74ACC|nr:PadR family transcriptional regulator [Nesterenkonia ebinurensis]
MRSHTLELRRGTGTLACLIELEAAQYGYGLLENLTAAGIDIDGNTLYPMFRRLEKQGLLTSQWNTQQQRPRKFYQITPAGQEVKTHLLAEWRTITATLDRLTTQDSTTGEYI